MNDLFKATEIYKKRLAENSNYALEIVDEWRENMPDEFIKFIYESEYGCHIVDEGMYDEAVSYLKWSNDKGNGAKWSVDEIKAVANIDFDSKDYYELDYCYVINMLYSDYCDVFTEPSYYVKMAKNYLEDKDYWGDPSERAYKNAKKRIKYNKSLL